jgi:hypothetical protein
MIGMNKTHVPKVKILALLVERETNSEGNMQGGSEWKLLSF